METWFVIITAFSVLLVAVAVIFVVIKNDKLNARIKMNNNEKRMLAGPAINENNQTDTKLCPYCGSELDGGETVCTNCGADLTK